MQYFVSEVSNEDIKKEKARAKTLRESLWWLKKRSTGICYFCGKKVPPRELTMEHRVPIIRGGKSEKGNIVPACKECNNKKKYMLPIEWQEYMDRLDSV